MSFVWELQLSEGSSGWSAVYPHLQTQEDMEGGVFKEKKVSAISLSLSLIHTSGHSLQPCGISVSVFGVGGGSVFCMLTQQCPIRLPLSEWTAIHITKHSPFPF